MLQAVLSKIDAAQEESLEILFRLVKFQSIATDPAFDSECIACAHWLKAHLESFGGRASLHNTTGQPVLLSRWNEGQASLPHVLFYGHYDVQPVDPLNLWATPPFEPRIGKTASGVKAVFGRGAADDKGQLLTFLEAVRAWMAIHGTLPFRLTVLLEGDEEGNSDVLDAFLKEQGAALKADIAMICDTEMWDAKTPAITTSLRGCISEDVVVTGPRLDLHSGYFGGPARNPLKALSSLIAKLHDAKGKVTVPGFYDGVKPVSKAKLANWKRLKLTEKEVLGPIGLKTSAGEKGFTLAEQLWARPTLEVNGFWGGYTGIGGKTVLPAKAQAKFSFRLVEGQKPKKVRAAFRAFMKANLPPDCKISFHSHAGDSTGIAVKEDNPWIAEAATALSEEWGVKTALVGSGVSIPVVECFRKHQKMESLLVGFARFDDAAHSPNEKYDLESFHRGTRSWARLFGSIAKRT
ncbi:M20/M25/M40 family metallo-hydrolase [Aestuariivirga litoralis]|uniref:M20/M25/M40 family metallo-hydrolase n=1 Tax=Aestuariivirga litoralis TaxID=2650924 RepID=UPI0018C6C015|nr:M20/M25/M40 family metallo-hydrolase [Aestuariivirga litoralis]MBG1232281.1 M20/M25/M40 family metallo-hydrolase [Aestuariivirga litoralis]